MNSNKYFLFEKTKKYNLDMIGYIFIKYYLFAKITLYFLFGL